jgi:hypothetical protein
MRLGRSSYGRSGDLIGPSGDRDIGLSDRVKRGQGKDFFVFGSADLCAIVIRPREDLWVRHDKLRPLEARTARAKRLEPHRTTK